MVYVCHVVVCLFGIIYPILIICGHMPSFGSQNPLFTAMEALLRLIYIILFLMSKYAK